MTSPVKFALVGAGAIAQSYAAALEKNPNVELLAVADPRRDAAEAFAKRFGANAYSDHRALLEDSLGLEAVIICTPPNTHEALANDFAGAGVHILCEKPFALSSLSARRMVKQALRSGVLLTMGSKFRYVADVNRAKFFLAEGLIGDTVLLENAFTGRVDMSSRWNSNPAVSGGGVLIDNGTHSVDILRYFLGPLAEVHGIEGRRSQDLKVEDTARLFVRAENGAMGSVDLSWSINKELDWYITIHGTNGLIQIGWKQSRYKLLGGDWVVFGNGYDKVQAFRAQVDNFAGAIRGEVSLVINAEDALASVEVIEAAYESMRAAPWTGVHNGNPLLLTPRPIGNTVTIRETARV